MLAKKDKAFVTEKLLEGKMDFINLNIPDLAETIVETLDKKFDIISLISEIIENKALHYDAIKPEVFITSLIVAKLKHLLAVSHVPVAIENEYLLNKLKVAIYTNGTPIMGEKAVRDFIDKYNTEEFVGFFNEISDELLILVPKKDDNTIHILDCTKIAVNLDNPNYEKSEVVKIDGEVYRGYKMCTLRQILPTGGIIEEIKLGSIKTHDLNLSKDVVLKSNHLKDGDTLVMDRGFIDLDFLEQLINKGVTVVMPTRKNMIISEESIKIAILEDKWRKHPNPKRKGQQIALVKDIGEYWTEQNDGHKKPSNYQDTKKINACVIKIDLKENKKDKKKLEKETIVKDDYAYITIISTDPTMSAAKIIRTYEQRPEIEEDFRQLKDFWGLCEFTSTKYLFIVCHLVMMLIGYNLYQLFKNIDEGEEYANKSLPLAVRRQPKNIPFPLAKVFIAVEKKFAVYTLIEFMNIYAEVPLNIRKQLETVLEKFFR